MLTGLKFLPGLLVFYAITVRERSFSKADLLLVRTSILKHAAVGTDLEVNLQPFLVDNQLLSTSLLIYLVTGTSGWALLSMKTILTQSRFGFLFVLNHRRKSNTLSLEKCCQVDEKGLQVFLLVALSIYGQLFPAQNPKSALNQPGTDQTNSIDFRQLFWIQSIVRQNRIWPILSFFVVLPAP